MIRSRSRFFYLFLLLLMLLPFLAYLETASIEPETEISIAEPHDSAPKAREAFDSSSTERKESGAPNPISPESSKPVRSSAAKEGNQATDSIDWGQECTIDELVEMAKNGQIAEIQWHMMPNIIRAQTTNGNITHIKNEDKGVDIVSVFKKAGVSLGKGGIPLRYLF